MNWSSIESAIVAWVRDGSGLTTGNVIYAAQGGKRPSTPYVSVTLSPGAVAGHDWLEVEEDAGGDAGETDLTRTHRGIRELTIGLQCYAAVATGAASPAAILGSVRSAAAKLSNREALRAAGVGLLDLGTVRRIDGVLNSTVFEPRAVLDVRASVPSELVDAGTYIETVEVTNQIPDPDETSTVQA